MEWRFTIPLEPKTKKNSGQILINRATGKHFIAPSKAFKEYQIECGWLILKPHKPIDEPVNIKALYYMSTHRKVDLVNLHSALHDILVHYGVVADDNSKIIAATDGSRVLYDKDKPRTEVIITSMEERGNNDLKQVKGAK